ncbi:MAG TPA: hypothetical protein VFC00_30020 [Micromonosporaceae bacterium]|nr:hypothetical protein [Micromonosporaceae bacterium]
MAEDTTGTDNKGTGTTATFSQADVDRIVRERLAREREKFSDYDDLKARAAEGDKNKTALERVLEKVSGLEERATKAERAALRSEVATAKKLPAWMAKRLTGDTREALESDADEMLAALKAEAGEGKGTEGDGDKAGEGKGTEDDKGAGGTGGKGTGEGKGTEGDKDKGAGDGRKSLPPSGRPTERLTSGAAPSTTGDKTPAQMAEEILKSGF